MQLRQNQSSSTLNFLNYCIKYLLLRAFENGVLCAVRQRTLDRVASDANGTQANNRKGEGKSNRMESTTASATTSATVDRNALPILPSVSERTVRNQPSVTVVCALTESPVPFVSLFTSFFVCNSSFAFNVNECTERGLSVSPFRVVFLFSFFMHIHIRMVWNLNASCIRNVSRELLRSRCLWSSARVHQA